jgi:hypothetical protein
MVGERATKRLADAAWNRLKGFGVLPVLLGGTGLDTSGQPSFDGSLPVPHLAANLQTWRPHTLLMPVTQCRQRHLEQARPSTRGAQHLGSAMGAHYRHTTPEMATRLVAAIQARLSNRRPYPYHESRAHRCAN